MDNEKLTKEELKSFFLNMKKEGLEILNEIQNILKPKIIYNQSNPIETMSDAIYQIKQDVDMKIQELSTYVYEMPIE